MAVLNVISSGSKGNCYLIQHKDAAIIVDIGVGKSKYEPLLKEISSNLSEIFLFLTHEHHDHTKGLKTFLNNYNPKIFCSMGTALQISKKYDLDVSNFYILDDKKIYQVDGFEVAPFKVIHDGAEPFGYHFTFEGKGLTFTTDLGVVTDDIVDFLKSSKVAILEANYEDSLLKNGNYPKFLKKRIESIKGHLSNKQAINTLNMLDNSELETVFLGHISEENNTYEIVEKYVSYCNTHFPFSTKYLKQQETIYGIKI
ncbi:MBL fold metallo-hydrolase [Deferribacter autotrophicus]|uniref:MBL fold metallo-hydrolase n=1 Tax=Deferribacter autotrophicus TaxID=500465 RepID=A0A5A8F182_9BACT|nr:MBL fold metallo-hydrolase [Deferribacter autotrophicus]KAA0257670.1 MBL fold metallo-hydrolase [Deferribacter autotrophicus]